MALGTLCYVHDRAIHDDVIKWKHFPRYWPFVRGIHRSLVNSPQKGQWRGALMLYVIYAWMKYQVSNRKAGDLRRHRAHYDVIVIQVWCHSADESHLSTRFILFCRVHNHYNEKTLTTNLFPIKRTDWPTWHVFSLCATCRWRRFLVSTCAIYSLFINIFFIILLLV